jgi:pimeloyl-ACP methyl ester carboxylesterase
MEKEVGRHRDELLAGLSGRVAEIGESGHVPMIEEPEKFNETIEAFGRRLFAAPAD